MRWSWNTLTWTNSWISAAMVIISPLICGKCQNKERYYGRKICEEKRKKRDQIRAGCCRLYESCDRLKIKMHPQDLGPERRWDLGWK